MKTSDAFRELISEKLTGTPVVVRVTLLESSADHAKLQIVVCSEAGKELLKHDPMYLSKGSSLDLSGLGFGKDIIGYC